MSFITSLINIPKPSVYKAGFFRLQTSDFLPFAFFYILHSLSTPISPKNNIVSSHKQVFYIGPKRVLGVGIEVLVLRGHNLVEGFGVVDVEWGNQSGAVLYAFLLQLLGVKAKVVATKWANAHYFQIATQQVNQRWQLINPKPSH